jgi:hypothetical protein
MNIPITQVIDTIIENIKEYEDFYNEKTKQNGTKKGVRILRKFWALRTISERLKRIKKLLQIEKYDLAFIGKVGVGKTTSICHLFNLLSEEEKIFDVEGEKITDKAIKEILSTGSGRTTICEVIIESSKLTSIKIEPYSEDEVREAIEIFATITWKKAKSDQVDDSDDELSSSDALPAELQRAIRNILKLKKSSHKGNKIDQAVELAKTINSYKLYRDELVYRANLMNRNITHLAPRSAEFSNEDKEKKWIEDTFKKINLCLFDDVSIPKKICINISPNIMDFSQYPFASIIDTRGIDEGKIREDLSHYIRNKDSTICIFTERFSDVPSNVINLIGKYLTLESKDINTKMVLMTMPRKGEASKIMGAQGIVSNKEEGINTRKDQIIDAFDGKSIPFLEENIYFYDCLQFYDEEDKTLKGKFTSEHIKRSRSNFLDQLSDVIYRRKFNLEKEVELLAKLVDQIQSGKTNPEEIHRISSLKKTIEEHQDKHFSPDLTSEFIKDLKSHHVMVFRAINNRCGIYERGGVNIFFDAQSLTEDLIRQRFSEPKSEIVGAIKNTQEAASEHSGLKPVLQVLRDQIDQLYEEAIIKLGEYIRDYLENARLAPLDHSNDFWVNVYERWGNGKGYRNDVLDMYRNKISDVNNFLSHNSQELWQQFFMQEILEFFAEDE